MRKGFLSILHIFSPRCLFLCMLGVIALSHHIITTNPFGYYLFLLILCLLIYAFATALAGWMAIPPLKDIGFLLPQNTIYADDALPVWEVHWPFDIPVLYSYYLSVGLQPAKENPVDRWLEKCEMFHRKALRLRILHLPDGLYSIQQLRLYATDILGLLRFPKTLSIGSVFVKISESAASSLLRSSDIHASPDLYRKRLYERQRESFFDYKVYEPGDDARRIIWRRFASSSILYVRLPEEPEDLLPVQQLYIDPILDSHLWRYTLPITGRMIRQIHRLLLFRESVLITSALLLRGQSVRVAFPDPEHPTDMIHFGLTASNRDDAIQSFHDMLRIFRLFTKREHSDELRDAAQPMAGRPKEEDYFIISAREYADRRVPLHFPRQRGRIRSIHQILFRTGKSTNHLSLSWLCMRYISAVLEMPLRIRTFRSGTHARPWFFRFIRFIIE